MTSTNDTTGRFREGLPSFVTYRIARVQNRLNAQATALLRKHTELSLTEWRVMSLVNLRGAITASGISREAEMDKGQISRAVKPLIRKGLLETKEHAKDSRQTILRLSERGSEIVRRNSEVMRNRQERLTHNISQDELDTFYSVLDKLFENTEMPEK